MDKIVPPSLALALAVALASCVPPQPATVSLRMQGTVDDASVVIDDIYVGSLREVMRRGVALPPGKHCISVEKTGYFPYDTVVTVREGDPPVRLVVDLKSLPR